ncbi:MotA/TolQ/ExbB proton channel family protein [Oceanicoccus sp. KOV_DT_Chl]|uniref:MotA/TolQ/ExbB proton channel family protein n=1 Tax=Oceanicoccus sp. KOV_DT_Chl TaxID=1904639 RepID=UPI00190F0674|nr:MotA/TolQ/ExbB proton channel family protein [Oceanicoccus sp. KOV_DT_Chl]
MEFLSAIIRFFQTGGPFMYPIAIVLVIGLAISIERWLVLTVAKTSNKKAFEALLPALKKGDFRSIVDEANRSTVPMARIIGAGVARFTNSNRRDDVEYAMEEGILEALPKLEKRTPYLATLANISTLLGLLGTIIGLIAAFTAVANAEPTEKAAMLSSSISVAMNTTAFGLIAAIPLLLLHSLLQTKTAEIVDSLEMAGVKVLNTLGAKLAAQTRNQDKPAA